MSFLSIFLTGVGLSMDAFAVALAKGMSLRKNLVKNAMRIAIFFGVFQAAMPLLGWWAGRYFADYIKAFDHWISFILLGAIGGKMIYESIKESKDNKSIAESQIQREVSVDSYISNYKDGEISTKDIIVLAIATSIDALAVGVSFAFLDVNIIPAITIIGLTTLILCIFAVLIGRKLGGVLQKYAEIIGGLILIIIGFKILIEHLFM